MSIVNIFLWGSQLFSADPTEPCLKKSRPSDSPPPLPALSIDTSIGKPADYCESCPSYASSTTLLSPNISMPREPIFSPIFQPNTTPIRILRLLITSPIKPGKTSVASLPQNSPLTKIGAIAADLSTKFPSKPTKFSAFAKPDEEADYIPKCLDFPAKKSHPDLHAQSERLLSTIKELQLIAKYYGKERATDPIISHPELGFRRIEALCVSPNTLQYYQDRYEAVMKDYDKLSAQELHSINPYRSGAKK